MTLAATADLFPDSLPGAGLLPERPVAEASVPARLLIDSLATPIGEARLVTDEEGRLRAFDWDDYDPRLRRLLGDHYGALPVETGEAPAAMRRTLAAYFAGAGDPDDILELPWATAGSLFQRRVWTMLQTIPSGRTLSYGALAQRLGMPVGAARAVGLANGSNPVAVVVPCHRVIGADGSLTGYGGGLHRKRWLLRHEGATFRDR
ncbi:MAG TPA: methylated-DNA--[protein]-cysteine S-methyltransferase [Hyphomicrobiales bacterium]|nr:methylated-DNA--[protein]-cysteine S-methyltransferase [Hyphomicrobiales bacterium]